jgi:hypothetical protein
MAKDTAQTGLRLEDLSDEEIERIEAVVFCIGGPSIDIPTKLYMRAAMAHPPRKGTPVPTG